MKTNLRLIGGRRLQSSNIIDTRPTTLMVREAIFNILKNTVENTNWLDLFSGSGSISCEAYNHGAKKIVAIEKNKINAKICLKNLYSLHNIENRKSDIEVICKDVLIWTKPNTQRYNTIINDFDRIIFDFIYLDPPYKANYHELVLNQIFKCNFIKKGTIVICEHSLDLDIKKNNLWDIYDVRIYGQTKLTFLIYI
ncbi:16S rRNA (guanine(966)-N(2))-methyltransferase RsmD [Prochlorococcus sp. AH-716-K03]|nr:16S rRNA (guanine(966)-N(2))-methyltransferase RsmD [Prochlorococcus sp. AH-716-K03]